MVEGVERKWFAALVERQKQFEDNWKRKYVSKKCFEIKTKLKNSSFRTKNMVGTKDTTCNQLVEELTSGAAQDLDK